MLTDWHICHLVLPLVLTTTVLASQSPADQQPTFDVVSVKPNKSSDTGMQLDLQPGGRLVVSNIPLKQFIRAAYTLQLYQIADAPAWVESERFDITAISGRDLAAPTLWKPGQVTPVQLMMQAILADRFGLRAHTERRDAQTYALLQHGATSSPEKLTPANTGRFDFEARWTPDSQPVPRDSDAPSLFTALQEQLGLRLEPRRAPVPMLVIDSINRPTAD